MSEADAKSKRDKALAEIDGRIDVRVTEATKELNDKVTELEKEKAAWEAKVAGMEKSIAESGVSLAGVEDEKHKGKQFSFAKALWALKSGDWKDAPLEQEVLWQTAKTAGITHGDSIKTLGTALGPNGGYLVPEQLMTGMIEMLQATPLMNQLGVTWLNGLNASPIMMNKKTGTSTAYMIGESKEPTASDTTYGQVSMDPKTMAILSKASNNLISMANESIEGMVRGDMVEQGALKTDQQCLAGTGGQYQLLGLENVGGNLNTVSCAGAMTMAKLFEFIAGIEQDNAATPGGSFKWAFNPRTMNIVRQFANAVSGDYFFIPEVWNWQKASILGFPYYMSTTIPNDVTVAGAGNCTSVYFGNWKDMVIGTWKNFEMAIKPLDQASDAAGNNAALLNQTWWIMYYRLDMMVRHDQSFSVCTDTTS